MKKITTITALTEDVKDLLRSKLNDARNEAAEDLEYNKDINLCEYYRNVEDYDSYFYQLNLVTPSSMQYHPYNVNTMVVNALYKLLNNYSDSINSVELNNIVSKYIPTSDLTAFRDILNQKRDFKKFIKELLEDISFMNTLEVLSINPEAVKNAINDAKSNYLELCKDIETKYIIHRTNAPLHKVLCSVSNYFTSCYNVYDGGYRSSVISLACDPRMFINEMYKLDILDTNIDLKNKVGRYFEYNTGDTTTIFKLYPFSSQANCGDVLKGVLNAFNASGADIISAIQVLHYSNTFKGYNEIQFAYSFINDNKPLEKKYTIGRFELYLLDSNKPIDDLCHSEVTTQDELNDNRYYCDCCGDNYDECDGFCIDGEFICDDCRCKHYIYCEDCDQYYNIHNDTYYVIGDNVICNNCIDDYRH